MKILWRLEKAFVKEILEKIKGEKPHYNTLSTIVRNLQEKGYVDHETFGNTHRYFPKISKEQYRRRFINSSIADYYDNSYKSLVSHFAKEEKISIEELKEIIELIEKKEVMEALGIYILKTSAIIFVFWAIYALFLKTETTFVENRYFLLFGILTAMLLPFVKIKKTILVELAPTTTTNVPINTNIVETLPNEALDWSSVLLWSYLMGCFGLFSSTCFTIIFH